MDNTKSFMDNYKYNVKKIMEIIEKKKNSKENNTKVNIKKEKE